MKTPDENTYDDEIDLSALISTILDSRRLIAKIIGVFIALGLIVALGSPIEYESSCKLVSETQDSNIPNIGGLAGLAGLAGVDMKSLGGSSSNSLQPELYPEIARSLPFIIKLLNDSIYFENENLNTSSLHFFKEVRSPSLLESFLKYTIGLPSLIFGSASSDSSLFEIEETEFYRLSSKDLALIEDMRDRISVNFDEVSGLIEINVEMPDPYAAAQLAKKIELMLTNAIVEYRTEKANKNLEFIRSSYLEAKKEFNDIQLKLAQFSDRNRNVSSATGQIALKKLEYEYDVSFSVYKGLSTQLENAKIKLREDTPVFTILEPVRIPIHKSEPKRKLILAAFFFMGMMVSIGYVLIKQFISDPKNKLQNV